MVWYNYPIPWYGMVLLCQGMVWYGITLSWYGMTMGWLSTFTLGKPWAWCAAYTILSVAMFF